MIRFVLLNGFIAAFTIMCCLAAFCLALFDRTGARIHFYIAVPWARTILRVCGVRVDVTGRENVRKDVPRIYMTNHQSFFDIFALLASIPVDFKFILKQELMKIPFLGLAMRRAGYIGIERKDPRKAVKSITEAAGRIRNGASVLIFPEGTRSEDGRLQEFKKGGFNLALKAGCDIVPVSIFNSCLIAPKGSLRIKKGSFRLHIGRPISLEGYGRKNMNELIEKVRAEILAGLGGPEVESMAT